MEKRKLYTKTQLEMYGMLEMQLESGWQSFVNFMLKYVSHKDHMFTENILILSLLYQLPESESNFYCLHYLQNSLH